MVVNRADTEITIWTNLHSSSSLFHLALYLSLLRLAPSVPVKVTHVCNANYANELSHLSELDNRTCKQFLSNVVTTQYKLQKFVQDAGELLSLCKTSLIESVQCSETKTI